MDNSLGNITLYLAGTNITAIFESLLTYLARK